MRFDGSIILASGLVLALALLPWSEIAAESAVFGAAVAVLSLAASGPILARCRRARRKGPGVELAVPPMPAPESHVRRASDPKSAPIPIGVGADGLLIAQDERGRRHPWARPASTPRNLKVAAPRGEVEIYNREDAPTIVSLTGDGR